MITSTHNPKLQLVRALLGRSQDRRSQDAFVAEGVRLVEEALGAKWPFRFVLVNESLNPRARALCENLQGRGVDVEVVTNELMEKVGETRNTQGMLAVLEHSSLPIPETISLALILDQIRDPGNMGTLLRTAAAMGFQAVFLPPQTADPWSSKVLRAGMGAHFHIPIRAQAWEEIRTTVSGLQVHLADTEGSHPCWEANLRLPLALIVGGEASGASPQARSLATDAISIPMPGQAESLNAAAAGAILMYEVARQRGMN